MKNKIILILLLLSITGIVVSSIQTSHHTRNIATGFETKSFCSINETINCDLVDASLYSKFYGLPVSGLGLIFYVLLIVVILRGIKNEGSLGFAYLMTIAAFVISLGMAYISFFVIKLVCLLCIAIYLVNLLLFLLFPLAMGHGPTQIFTSLKHAMKKLFRPIQKSVLFGNLILTLVFFITGGLILNGMVKKAHAEATHKAELAQQAKKPVQKTISLEDVLKLHFNQPQVDLDVSGTHHLGNEDASVVIVEFSDFECPYCKKAAEYLKPIIKEYETEVAFRFINFPLDRACNPGLQRDLHKNACKAARAVYCAGKQDKFWEFHDILFSNQPRFSDNNMESYSKEVGLEQSLFNKCLKGKEAEEAIATDLARGKTADIHGTPSLFINGRPVQNWNDPIYLKALLDAELKK